MNAWEGSGTHPCPVEWCVVWLCFDPECECHDHGHEAAS